MTTNDRIILDEILDRRLREIDPEGEASSFFEFFTAEQVLKDFDLSYDEIESGLVGGSGDGGVDAIYLLVNGDLVQEDSDYSHLSKDITIDLLIMQSKTSSGFQETPIERFITVSSDLFDLSKAPSSLTHTYNERLIAAIQLFHEVYQQLAPSFPTLNVAFYYASKGVSVNDSVQHKVTILETTVTTHFSECHFSLDFLGAAKLLELARRQPQRTYGLPLAESPISSGDQVGFVCLVRLQDYFEFITDESKALRRQMFEANVRDYQGRTQVNDEIQASLKESTAEDFWWLNNGISIVATQASLGGKMLTIEEPQIVNGLQTSREVFNYCRKESGESEDDRTILVRVMVPEGDDSRDRIIKATNSQTVVQMSSLRATDKIHRDIEEYLKPRGLFYDRRKNYYRNEGKPRSNIVSIPYLAQAVMAIILRRPDTARARPSSLLKSDEDYNRVFNSSYPIQLYHVCTEALRRVEKHLRIPSLNVAAKDRNNLRFYVAMEVVAGTAKQPMEIEEIAGFDLNQLDHSVIDKSLGHILARYIELGGNDQVAKGPSLLKEILQAA